MRYRLMATYRGAPYEAGIGPEDGAVVLFAACPPPEELGFEPATGHWRKELRLEDVQAVWQSRPVGTFRGDSCIVLDDLGDRLHIGYLGHDAYRAEQLGYWQVDRGVFELVTARDEVTNIIEERTDYQPGPASQGDYPQDDYPQDDFTSMPPGTEPAYSSPASQLAPGYPNGAGLPDRSRSILDDGGVIVPPPTAELPLPLEKQAMLATEQPLPLEAEAMRAASAASRRDQPAGPVSPAGSGPAANDASVPANGVPPLAGANGPNGPVSSDLPDSAPAGLDPAEGAPASNGPSSNGPASNGAAWSGPAWSGPAWNGPASNGPAWSDPAGSDPVGNGSLGSGPAGYDPASYGPPVNGSYSHGPAGDGAAPPADMAPAPAAPAAPAEPPTHAGSFSPAGAIPSAGPIVAGAPVAGGGQITDGGPGTNGNRTSNGGVIDHGSPVANGSPIANGGAIGDVGPRTNGGPTENGSAMGHGGPTANGSPTAHGGPTANGSPTANGGPTANGSPTAHAGPVDPVLAADPSGPSAVFAAPMAPDPAFSAGRQAVPVVAGPHLAAPAVAGPAVDMMPAPRPAVAPLDTSPPRTTGPGTTGPGTTGLPVSGGDVASGGEPLRRRRAGGQRLDTERIFAELASLATIPATSYSVGEEVDGAMCLLETPGGFEVFSAAGGARHEVRAFPDEESACFYLFGVLAADAVRTGVLVPGTGRASAGIPDPVRRPLRLSGIPLNCGNSCLTATSGGKERAD